MAAFTAWATANMGAIVAAVVAVVIAFINRDKIQAHLPAWVPGSTKEDPAKPVAAADGSLTDVIGKVTVFVHFLQSQADAVKRSIHLTMLVAIEDDIAALPDSPEKTEQLAALQTLAKFRVVPAAKPIA